MRRYLISILGVLLLTACSKNPDRIILARVGDDIIRVSDLKKAYVEESLDFSPQILADPEGSLIFKKKVLEGLVQVKLLLQTAEAKNIKLSSEELQAASQKLTEGYSQASLQKVLDEHNISYEDWLKRQGDKALIDKLIDAEVYATMVIGPEEVEKFYQKNKKQFREPDRIHCLHIVTSKREKARTILTLLNKGENFTAIAQQYSESPDRDQGGDLGYIAYGEYPTIFSQACFTLALGQTSDVVPSEYGFHIFRVVDKKPGHPLKLDEVRSRIEKQLREIKGRSLLGEWLKSLYQDANISIDEEALKAVTLIPPKILGGDAASAETKPVPDVP